ncbi:MAG: amidase family protein, partial [Pseudomonadota bacterium]
SAFLEAARLLYEGPWVAERWTAFGAVIADRPDAVDAAVRSVVGGAPSLTAVETFTALHRLPDLRRRAAALWSTAAALVTPTTGTIYTKAALAADPVTLNANLGVYTNFMNLLDYAGVAVPAGFDSRGLPFGVTFTAPAFADDALLRLAARHHHAGGGPLAAGVHSTPPPAPRTPAPGRMRIAVCGAHLSGEPLNHQLRDRGGALIGEAQTAPVYRMLKVGGAPVPRPGLLRVAAGGASLPVEIWEIDAAGVGSFLAGIAAPLGLGRTLLADGRQETGFVCEAEPGADAIDITEYGGWRAWRAAAVNTSSETERLGT